MPMMLRRPQEVQVRVCVQRTRIFRLIHIKCTGKYEADEEAVEMERVLEYLARKFGPGTHA